MSLDYLNYNSDELLYKPPQLKYHLEKTVNKNLMNLE